MKSIADIFGIEIESDELFRKALTHSSYTKDRKLPYDECYERMEFLGDAVLKLAISDILFRKYPQHQEGELSKIRSIVVSDTSLANVSKQLGLHEFIIISEHDEKQGYRMLDSICACSFEALLGAYYLEGKFDKIVEFLDRIFTPLIKDVDEHFEKFNAKSILQEYTQEKTKNIPLYRVTNIYGPAHKKEFEVEVVYNDEVLATECGKSKKEAEQKCAYSACKKLGII